MAMSLTWLFWKLIEYTRKLKSDATLRSMDTDFLRVLIVGGSKSGKTSTLKYLAGHGRHITGTIPACPNLKYVRNDDVYGWKIFAGKCENLSECSSEDSDNIHKFYDNLRYVSKALGSFHVVVFCLSFENCLSHESKEYINALRSVLGSSFIEKYIIFALTNGEVFEETKHDMGLTNFSDWLHGLDPCMLKDALKECKNRCVLLHNKTDKVNTKKEDVLKIFSLCTDIVWENATLSIEEEADDKSPQPQMTVNRCTEKEQREIDLVKDISMGSSSTNEDEL